MAENQHKDKETKPNAAIVKKRKLNDEPKETKAALNGTDKEKDSKAKKKDKKEKKEEDKTNDNKEKDPKLNPFI